MLPIAYIANTISSFEDLINSKITQVLGITSEVKKLVNRLKKVFGVLEDAERKKIGNEDVKRWLVELREVVLESEKVIDYCRIENNNIRRKEKEGQQQVAAIPRLLSSCFNKTGLQDEISKRIRTLNLKMQAILKEEPQLNLEKVVSNKTRTAVPTQNLFQSPSSNTCIGATIETDTNFLVNILTKEEEGESHHLMAIVGIGGIGKTTLARKIFNDERIRGSFDIRIWISLTLGLKDTILLAKIIGAAGGNPGKSTSHARLMPKLTSTIAEQRFLIVLDDVSDSKIWDNLLKLPLQAGARGSRILVTTTDETVAAQMGATHVHDMKSLSPEEGWLLLREYSSLEDEDESDILVELGLNISERCGGLPLAIKTVGGILKKKSPTIKDWQTVSKSKTWFKEGLPEGIPRALYLGYEDLPLNLKPCFLYCSLFPRNLCIDRHDLIKQWISEGFLARKDGSTLEQIGEEYYKELEERYLINPEQERDDIERNKMHECLVNMARLLSADEILVDEINKLAEITFRPCHASLGSKGTDIIPEEIKNKEKLRTLILSKNPLKDDGLRDIFTSLKLLRVLDMSETSIEVIPNTLQNLLHLRYLDLSRTKIKKLPESIGFHSFLQFLLLQECKRLHSLPKGIENLKSLENIDLNGTGINRFCFRIGKLVNLNSLDFFILNTKMKQQDESKGWSLGELKSLNKLTRLHILEIEKLGDRNEAKEASLGTKPCLKELELSCSMEATPLETPTLIQNVEAIIDELCPPPCLKTLKIKNYFGTKYPSWLSYIDLLSNLQQLELINCQCQTLPQLGQLPQLQFLYIANASYLRDIGPDIMGSGQEVSFPKLEKLHIQSLHELESWIGLERPGPMPCLKAFQLESCPKIRFLPSCMQHSKSLTELRIIDCKSLKLIENLTRIQELGIWNTPNIRKISNLTALEDLSISSSPNLKIIEHVSSLKSVQIFDYDLEAIPRWLKKALDIQSLDLGGTVKMLQRCLINGPDWDIIQDITHVYGHSNSCTYFLYNKSPFSFETNLSVLVHHQVENSSVFEGIVTETILEENQDSFSQQENLIIDEIITVAPNTRIMEPSASRSLHLDPPTIAISPIYSPTTTIGDNILVNMSENTFDFTNHDETTDTNTSSLVRRGRKHNTEDTLIDSEQNVHTGSMSSNLVINFDLGMPNNTPATTEETLISKLKSASSHKRENITSTVALNTRSKEPSSLRPLHLVPPTITIDPIYSSTTTIGDNILVNMSENTFDLSNHDDTMGTNTNSLVRRRRRKHNTDDTLIDSDKNADIGPMPSSNLFISVDFGMPNNTPATTEEALISKQENALSHKRENNTCQNAIDSLSLDLNSPGNIITLSPKIETLGHLSTKKQLIEKPRSSFASSFFYTVPIVSTNEERLVERDFTLNSKIETLSHQSSEKQAGKNVSSDLEAKLIQILRPNNFDSTLEPVNQEGIIEEVRQFFTTVKGIINVAIEQVKGIRQSHKIEEDKFVKKPIENVSSPEAALTSSSTSESVYTCKSGVNDKLLIKERLKDYLIVILLAVSVMQLLLILGLVLRL